MLADKGYTGARIGVHVPVRRPKDGRVLDPGTTTYTQLLTALCAPAERANALLTGRWRALQRVTLDPSRITAIAAALVLTSARRGRW